MDEYDKKFAEMQKYIPFLEAMIDRLQKVTDSSRVLQLQKMQQLHGILTSKKRKLKLETLKKCEAVLLKLHSKVDKGANALTFPVKKSEDIAEPTNDPQLTVEQKLEESPNRIKEPDKAKVKSEETPAVVQQKEIKVKKKMNETPASPSPPASPDPESSSNNIPIVIPTESAPGYASNVIDKPSNPDQCETLSTKKPIVTSTESRLKKLDDKSNSRSELPAGVTNSPVNSFDEWSILEASEKSASKLGQNNKVDSKQNRRHMPVASSPSAVSRKFGSPSEKNSDSGLSDVAKELIKSNSLKQCRNESPPDPFRSKKTSTLLVSPPTERSAPLLSKLDLAELLNDNLSKNTEKSDKKNIKERSFVENKKIDNEKKGTKNISESIDKDSERCWEEVDKHIVKMTPRNNIPLSNSRSDSLKTELKSQIHSSNNKNYNDNYDRNPRHSSDFRNNPDPNVQIPNINVIKNALSRISEDDYANLANIHIHNEGMTNADDRNPMHHRRAPSHPPNDMHLHRGGPPSYLGSVEPDFRRENLDSRHQDHYDMHSNQPPMHQQPGGNSGFCGPQWRGQNPNLRGHPNGSQLSPRQSHYQHPGNLPPPDNWNVANPGIVDGYSPHHMQNQYGPNLNRGGRSMMSPNNEINFPEDRPLSSSPHSIPSLMSSNLYPQSKFNSFPHENRPIEQPFDRPAEFSRGPARQPWEPLQNRTNDAPFERPNEYSHGPPRQQWSGPPNRPNEIPYERPVEYPHGPSRQTSWDTQPNRTNEPNFHEGPRGRGADGPYSRPTNTDPLPWNRGNNDPPNRGRGGDRFINERGRTGDSSFSSYNRRSDWDRPPSSADNSNRFGIRDPRYRPEPTPQQPNNSNISNARRDPRLVKDNNSQILTINNKSKENPSSVSRDPRRRNSETKETNKPTNSNNIVLTNNAKVVEKTKDTTIRDDSKSKKPSVDSKSSNENTITEKLKKDIESMKSPLHSLYGAIDTTAKTGKGYGLQKFKIPKIKKPLTPRPPTPPRPSPSHFEEKWDVDVAPVNEEIETQNDTSDKLQDEKKMEVTSTTEESSDNLKPISPIGNDQGSQMSEAEATTKVVSIELDEDENPQKDIKEEPEVTVDTSTASKETEIKSQSPQEDSLKVTDTVTQELIEALIRKSLESGEGKKLLEQAKLLEKLGEAFNAKKYKKIRKIIDSESESSSSDDKKAIESRKKILKKKKPVIESDSSEEECLANRLDNVKESPPKSPVKDSKTKIDTEAKTSKSESDDDKKEDADLKKIVDEEILQDDAENKEEDEHSHRSEIEEVKKQIKTPVKKKRKAKKATVKRKTKKVEEVVNEETEVPKEDKEEEVIKPVGKQRKQRRRNSLEMLQEDIREMFISEGVVTATGHRMCRLIKEAQGNLPSIEIDDKTNPLGDASSLELLNEMNSDEGEFNLRSRSRSSSKRSKTPDEVAFKPKETRTRKCTTKLSKEIISTSDSDDDDDNLVLRNINSGRRSKDPLAVSPTSDDNLDDSGPTLRRSERVALKEPRVVIEKTELSKIDSSNVFDTSSDESFGIDVTELTAAVDISLHPERNSAGQGTSTSKVSKKKKTKRTKKTKNKKTLDTNDRKSNNTPLTFDDDASIASDASVASSNASAVKKSCNPTSTDTNEELITNIIGELASDKEKEVVNTSVDKVTDVDNDEYMDTSHEGIKKPQPLKRKKKRASWQMGVVPKSKKKKTCQTSNDSSNSAGITSEDTKNDSANISNENDLDSGDLTLNENKGKTNTKAVSKINEKKQLSVTIEKIQDIVEELPYPELELNQLIEYAWTGQERYKCLLCPFSGKNIVHHYIHHHPKNETMISRLTLLDAKRAIDEAKDEEFINLSEKVNSGPTRKFICRFCAYTFEGEKHIAMEHFYEHCTTHTGEYRFSCKCKYQTTIKSSMRAHYYKTCRKSNENFAVSVHEDPIPSDEYIPGYLCSLCNFIQLKEPNIKNHIEKIHKSNSDTEIIKINMSGYLKVKDNVDFDRSFGESMTLKYESDSAEENDSKVKKIEKDKPEAIKSNDDIVEIPSKNSSVEKSDLIQDDGDNSLSKKLNAFVCPPELENKEVEIQLERKKKMQEIADNIGLKIQKDTNEKRFSIIDKLKNKMTTSETQSVSDNANVEDGEYLTLHNDEVTERVANDVSELAATQLIDAFEEEPRFKSEFISQTSSSVMHHTSTESRSENSLKIDEEADALTAEKSDKKLKDPLALFHDDAQKDCNSELEEASDFEAAADVNRPYESDSSDEVSDTEIQTAVSSLLKQTINTSTKVPMMNTIHRLAAQLKGDKSFTATSSEETTKDTEDDADNDLMETDDTFMKLPIITNVVSESVENESPAQEQISVIKQTDDSGPKNFIRLRRLPGDLLSTGDSDSNKKLSSESSSVSSVESPTAETGPETTVSNPEENVVQSSSDIVNSGEEEGSFLKIENVVSLAPSYGNPSDEPPLVTNIRKAFGTSPVTSAKPVPVSVLKKVMTPNILKKLRPVNNVDGVYSLPIPSTSNTNTVTISRPTSSTSGSKNFKIVKVLRRGSTILKPKDPGQNTAASKLKNPDAYKAMLTASKLRHLYKCMARSCSFSTDSCDTFGKHFQSHAEYNSNQSSDAYDYQRCAYCDDLSKTWEDMKAHYKSRHSFCSFQCTYCFYRAFTQSYVELHQKTRHPGKPVSVILGMRDYHPAEMIDRREHVLPFICKHECNKLFYVPEAFIAHLKTKHGSTLALFKCHLCETTNFKAELLINHYKMHGIYKYQCLYCLSGADATIELHNHLGTSHCNRPPKILERSLPPQPVRDKDVLLQLIIRNLDDNYKCTELKIVSDGDNNTKQLKAIRPKPPVQPIISASILSGKNQVPSTSNIKITGLTKPPIPILPRPANSVSQRPSVKVIGPRDIISILENDRDSNGQPIQLTANTKEMIMKESNNFSHNGGITVLKIAEKPIGTLKPLHVPRVDNSTNSVKNKNIDYSLGSNSDAMSAIHPEPELELRYVSDQLKTQIVNAVDPLSIPDNPNCQDEFINTNFFDSNEILKPAEQSLLNFDKNEITKNPDNDDTNNNNDNKNDDDLGDDDDDDNDSDIEILEYIQHSNKTANKTKDNQSSVQSTSGESEFKPSIEKIESLNPEDFRNTISEDKLELQNFSSTDNSTANNSTEKSNTDTIKIYKTLDDIKHTGYAGTDLYKCGYSACDFSAEVPGVLKEHIIQCELANETKELFCVHCQKRFFKIGYLLDHFKSHGLKRFGCSLCNQRFPVSHQAVSHMKMKHKSNHRMLPADPTNPSENGLFILHACKNPVKIKKGKIKGNSKNSKIEEKISFSPADIESLPRQAIYQREVQCAVCPYKTKVRTNIVRHLQLHATEENVPESGPVNPVPCLDKKERMFDKMVNLASSSHQNGRMSTGAPKETVSQNEIESLPKFVPENKRYICSVALCNYITVEESTLRDHMKALHPEEQYFRCPHCPTPSPGQESQNIIIDKMGVHLKMHDTKLYKCSHCNHHHYHRHVVERHLTDKHPEKRPFVKVIREIENAENSQPTTPPEETEDGPCDKDGNYWKCNLCEHKCAYKHEMSSHMISAHNEKSQFKCGLCIFKTPSKMSLEQHIVSKHINDDNVDYTLTYERVKGTKKVVESTDQISVDEPFDTTPLWRRDMPRIRHIRGILYEDEPTSTSENSGKASKRKSDAEISSKPAKIKVKSSSLDGSPEKNKIQYKINDVDIDSSIITSVQGDFDLDLLEKKYGSYGKPDGERYTCTLCNSYKSRYRQDIRDHIYRELQYWRMHCKSCGYMAVSHSYLTKHVNRVHKNIKPEIIAIQPNKELETWVQTLISKQLAIIRGSMGSRVQMDSPVKIFGKSPVKSKADNKKVIPPTITLEDSDSSVIPSATIDRSVESAKKVDLTEKISNMQDTNSSSMQIDSDFNDNDNDDDDDDDNALVIDSKDDSTIEENKSNKVIKTSTAESTCTETKSKPEKSLVCKHCGAKFSRWHGFKLHVGTHHLKCFNFLCPYCDRSVNDEAMMRYHVRNKHPGCPETIIDNPAAGGLKLTDEFWEREYGLIRQKKPKKRKLKVVNTEDKFENNDKGGAGDICVVCGFTAINATGLAAHMRAHANKHTLKCAYCSFTANSKSDVWQHSEINHPLEDWKAEEINTPGTSDQPPQQYTKIRNEQDYSNDIEEEKVTTNPSNIESIYDCFYCNLRSSSLDSIKKHWCNIHRDYNETSKFKTGVPFRFKESLVNNLSIPKFMKCGYCPKKSSIALMRLHCRKKHPNLPPKFSEAVDKSRDIYICKWCNEVCESNTKMNHHNMFHSHLPIRFRREEEISAVQRGYACTVCDFSNVSLMRVKRHIGKHYDNYRCKRCNENFPTIALATQHSTKEHPSLAAAIEGTISNLDALLAGITETYVTSNSSTNSGNDDTIPSHEIFRNLGVAKKSTTKQLLRPSTGSVVRAVARKSTHPLPRYPPGVVFPIDDLDGQSSIKSEGFSYYGLPREPIDLSNLSTTMTVGSFKTKIECTALAKLFNIDPNVIVTDIKTDQKYSSLIQYQAPSLSSQQQQPQPSSSLSSLPSPSPYSS